MPSSEPDPDDLLGFYEDGPCGFLTLAPDGTVLRQNRTFLRSTGHTAADLAGRRLQDLLSPGSRILHATTWDPALELRGHVRELPVELLRADGTRLPVLVNADLQRGADGSPAFIRVSVFDAGDRRRYERELVAARDVERDARRRVERLQRIGTALSVALTPADVAAAVLDELAELCDVAGARVRTAEGTLGEVGEPRPGPQPGLSLPLEVHGRAVGTLDLTFDRRRALEEPELDLARACAAQCGQALVRAQLYVEVERRSAQQAALARLGASALEAVAPGALLREAVEVVRSTLQAAGVAIREHADGTVAAGDAPPAATPAIAERIGPPARPFGTLLVHLDRPAARAERAFARAVAFVLWNAIDRHRTEQRTRWQARHDHVTGLRNRLALEERLQERVAAGTPFAVALVDLDDFKLVNDSLGHEIGDDLLRDVGARLVIELDDLDLVARLGGDEFVVIGEDPETLPARVLAALERPFAVGRAELPLRVSIGVVAGDGGSAPATLLRDADVAMYLAKERGRGRSVRFEPAMLDRGRERLQVEAELRVALAEGQLRVFYQPIVDARDGRLRSLEALVRWEHPERGLVPPDAFIPVAEQTGLVLELGDHVLAEACAQLVRWRAAGTVGPDVAVAVNVSGRQLLHPGFPGRVVAALERSGLTATPGLLHLEITETVLMEAGDSPDAVLRALAALGVGLHLDDFGTGASSLARLKRFPVDTLKVDRAFVAGVTGEGTEDDAIVAAVMGMARALGLAVVAEGVETAGQQHHLRRLGCDLLQGYRFSPPRPAAAVPALLAELRDGAAAAAA